MRFARVAGKKELLSEATTNDVLKEDPCQRLSDFCRPGKKTAHEACFNCLDITAFYYAFHCHVFAELTYTKRVLKRAHEVLKNGEEL